MIIIHIAMSSIWYIHDAVGNEKTSTLVFAAGIEVYFITVIMVRPGTHYKCSCRVDDHRAIEFFRTRAQIQGMYLLEKSGTGPVRISDVVGSVLRCIVNILIPVTTHKIQGIRALVYTHLTLP